MYPTACRGEKRESTQDSDAQAEPVPREQSVRQLRGRLKFLPRAQQPAIERQRRPQPKGEARKVGPLDEGIGILRCDQPHNERDVLQPFANAYEPSVHGQEMLDARYKRGDLKSREDRPYPKC